MYFKKKSVTLKIHPNTVICVVFHFFSPQLFIHMFECWIESLNMFERWSQCIDWLAAY